MNQVFKCGVNVMQIATFFGWLAFRLPWYPIHITLSNCFHSYTYHKEPNGDELEEYKGAVIGLVICLVIVIVYAVIITVYLYRDVIK